MVTGRLYVANAGGAFPGGMFGIGVLEGLAKEIKIAEVTGASAGAVNALLVANGQAQTGVEVWREVLGSLPNVMIDFPFKKGFFSHPVGNLTRFYRDWAENPTFFRVQKPVFDTIQKHASLEQFLGSAVHARIIYNKINDFLVTGGEEVRFPEQLVHLLSWVQLFTLKGTQADYSSKRGILDNRACHGLSREEFVKKLQASCSLPPFYPRAIKFGGEGIINDGCLIDKLGGADLLVQEASLKQDVAVLVIMRHGQGSGEYQRRLKKLHELCRVYGLPVEKAVLVSPRSGLPVTSHYTNDIGELNQCYEVGKQAAVQALRKL